MVRRGSITGRRTCVSWAILGFLVLLILVGLVSGGAYLYLRFAGLPGWSNPAKQLRTDQIEPTLALLALAGVNDLDVVGRALEDEQLETGYATILFSTDLSSGERVGNLLLVSQAYAAAGNGDRAQLCYRLANLIVTLSSTMSDYAKASAYLGIGEGLARLGNKSEALFNYDQAYVVAVNSPHLKDPHRADVLEKLAEAYSALGEMEKASECSDLQAELRYVTGEPKEASEGSPEQPVSPFVMEIPEPTAAMVTSYEQKRMETVLELVEFLEGASEKTTVPEELRTEVAQALVNEDNARRAAYDEQLAGASSMVLKMGVAEAGVDWLTVKYRIALDGYGFRLVPAWSDDLAGIEAELNAAYGELHSIYDEQISTFSDDTAVDRAWYDVLRFEIERGRLGLYPDYPEEELLSQLTEATVRLVASGDPSLFVEVLREDETPVFRLAAPD